MTSKRILTPYEKNQLSKYYLLDTNLDIIGDSPVEYLTGHAEFDHLDFIVTKDTLIPRIETEEVINHTIEATRNCSKSFPFVIADIGTGSGCLGITIALKLSQIGFIDLNLYLSDISASALKIASLNTTRLLPKTIKVNIISSDLLSSYPITEKINILLANLPYIPSDRISNLDNSVKNFEPLSALDGGPEGTTLINKLLYQLPYYIGSPFFSILEIDDSHNLSSFKIPQNLTAEILNDQFGQTRFLTLKK